MSKFSSTIGKQLWKNMKQIDSKQSPLEHLILQSNRRDIMPLKQKSKSSTKRPAKHNKDKMSQTKSTLNFFRTSATLKNSNHVELLSRKVHYKSENTSLEEDTTNKVKYTDLWNQCKKHFVALDCEMVENVHGNSQLARCSVVDSECDILLDFYVKPKHAVADYRHRYSGITPEHINSATALYFEAAQSKVLSVLKGKILVGHSIENDFKVLNFQLPPERIVDIQGLKSLKLLMTKAGLGKKSNLKMMSQAILKKKIQVGTHCSVEDAAATMQLFKRVFPSWAETNCHIIQARLENNSYLDDKYWKGVYEPNDNNS